MGTIGKNKSFKTNTAIWGFSLIVERAVSLLVLPLLTKTLGRESYGVWTQIIVTSSIATTMLSLGFNTSLVRFAAGKNKERISALLHRSLFIIFVGLFLFLIILFSFKEFVSIFIFGDVRFTDFIFVLGFFVAVELLFEVIGVAVLRSVEMITECSIYYLARYIIRAVVLFFGVLCFKNFLGSMVFIGVMQLLLIVLIYYKDIIGNIGFSLHLDKKEWRKVVAISVPLVFYNILLLLMLHSNRYVVLQLLNIEQLGTYATNYALASTIGIFCSVICFTLYPRVAALWNNNEIGEVVLVFRKSLIYYLFFVTMAITLLSALNAPIVVLLATSGYLAHYLTVFSLNLALLFLGLYQLHFYIILLRWNLKNNISIIFLAFLVMIMISIFLTPTIGINGSAIALLISCATLGGLTIREARKIAHYQIPWIHIFKNILYAIISFGGFVALGHFLNLFQIANLILMMIIMCAIYLGLDLRSENSIIKELFGEYVRKNILDRARSHGNNSHFNKR